jgi:hypothetical protein
VSYSLAVVGLVDASAMKFARPPNRMKEEARKRMSPVVVSVGVQMVLFAFPAVLRIPLDGLVEKSSLSLGAA